MSGADILILAFGWVLVIEGFTPMLMPEAWQKALKSLTEANPRALRAAASVMVAVGLVIIWTYLGSLSGPAA